MDCLYSPCAEDDPMLLLTASPDNFLGKHHIDASNDSHCDVSLQDSYIAVKRWQQHVGLFDKQELVNYVLHKGRTPLEMRLYFKILGRRLEVNYYRVDIDSHCPRCALQNETIEHYLFDCRSSTYFWHHFQKMIRTLLEPYCDKDKSFSPPQHITLRDIVLFFPEWRHKLNENDLYRLVVMHSCALYSLWRSRVSFYQQTDHFTIELFRSRLQARILNDIIDDSLTLKYPTDQWIQCLDKQKQDDRNSNLSYCSTDVKLVSPNEDGLGSCRLDVTCLSENIPAWASALRIVNERELKLLLWQVA